MEFPKGREHYTRFHASAGEAIIAAAADPSRGDRWRRTTLLEAALAAIRVKGSALGARYRRVCRYRGHKIAILAVAHAILEIVWHLPAKGTTYHELGADYIDRRDKDHATRRYVRLIENLGHGVTLEPIPIAA